MSKATPGVRRDPTAPDEFDPGARVRRCRVMTMRRSLGSRPALRALALSLGLTAGLIFSIPSATATEELVKLTASDGTVLGHFGNHVDVSGDTAVVGAPKMHFNAVAGPGAAYVFTRSGDAWVQQAKLTPSDGLPGDRFGWSVAISGNTIVVGAMWDDVGVNADQGSAYVFTRTAGTWTEQTKLTASDGLPLEEFGISVEASGDDVIVGATSLADEVGVPPQGSAYVFARSGGTWIEQAELIPSDGYVGDGFGFKVGADGDTAVVGAYKERGGGSAYVFSRTGGTWTQQAKLTSSDRAAGDQFGFWVGISGQTMVVGALFADGTYADQGAAYVFTRAGGVWTEQKKLTASDGRKEDAFGRSVAVSGDTIVVGAQWHNVDGKNNQGSAYVFSRTRDTWVERTKLTAADGAEGDHFGVSVGVSGDTAVVGASFNVRGEGPIRPQGAAYVWKDDAAGRHAPPRGSASRGGPKEQQARSGAGARTNAASLPATIPSSSVSTVAGHQSGVADPGDPSRVVEPRALDHALPVGPVTERKKDFLPTAGLVALLLVTMGTGGFQLKKRFGRTTT